MDFKTIIGARSAAAISSALGCPLRTAYAWKSAERMPAPWLQQLIVERLVMFAPKKK